MTSPTPFKAFARGRDQNGDEFVEELGIEGWYGEDNEIKNGKLYVRGELVSILLYPIAYN